ncbi:MAG: hypothetical protein JXL80_00820 [Planctomycetes bacterium]|nr:hypothetical protein [Planctomycetota bacterium]
MSWTGVKRWVATHPEPSIAVAGLFFLTMPWVLWVGVANSGSAIGSFVDANPWLLAGPPAAFLFGVSGTSFCIVCLRARAGLPHVAGMCIGAAFRCALMVTAISAGLTLVGWFVGLQETPQDLLQVALLTIVAGAQSGLYVAVVSGIGATVGRSYARRQITRGKWEVTTPVEPPKEQP